MASPFLVSNLQVANEAKVLVPIETGVGYLDHMIDQLNSHAQVGVGLSVESSGSERAKNNSDASSKEEVDRNRLASLDQHALCATVGTELGKAIRELIATTNPATTTSSSSLESRFCCPLDEALVECSLLEQTSSDDSAAVSGGLESYTLPPFGLYPTGKGRVKIGELETCAIESFWKALAISSQLQIRFNKVRGDNGHHIVESSFKAFSRALRNLLDPPHDVLWKKGSVNDVASQTLRRHAVIQRSTKETSISVNLLLLPTEGNNGQEKKSSQSDGTTTTPTTTHVETGIPLLDEFYTTLATEADMTLEIQCTGDVWVDDHHTAEDVSIAVGQCLTQALGTKAGLNRMWLSSATHGDATVEVTMDLSNRPYLGHNLHARLGQQEYVDTVDDTQTKTVDGGSKLSCEMLEHVLDSLVMNGRMTVHIVEQTTSTSKTATVKDTVLATAMAFGRALRVCAMVDTRRAGQTASSKGTLSV